MLVRDRVGDGHRAGQGELELALRVGARRARLELVDGALAADRAGHGRDLGLVAVGADADRLPAVEVDAVEIGEKAVDEMDARLLAVADDVDASVLLALDREDGGVDLARLRARRPRASRRARVSPARRARGASAGCRRRWSRTWADPKRPFAPNPSRRGDPWCAKWRRQGQGSRRAAMAPMRAGVDAAPVARPASRQIVDWRSKRASNKVQLFPHPALIHRGLKWFATSALRTTPG